VPAERGLVVQSRDFESGQHGQRRGPWRADHPTVSAARVWLQRGGETRLSQGDRTTSLRPEWFRAFSVMVWSLTVRAKADSSAAPPQRAKIARRGPRMRCGMTILVSL
jgi:hypothetical protein